MEHATITILLALLCIGLVVALPYGPARSITKTKDVTTDVTKIQACGSKLSEQIAETCKGFYNTFYPSTSSDSLFLKKREAKMMLRRRRRGITNECCRKSCSLSELMSFCGQP